MAINPKAHLEKADLLKSILAHTFKYRASQLFEFIHTITKPVEARTALAQRETGANDNRVQFVRVHVVKISRLLDTRGAALPPEMIKNKILRNFFDGLRDQYDDALIDRAQTLLQALKVQVKAEFPLQYFYCTKENVTHGGLRQF